jgi:hypothetical protein
VLPFWLSAQYIKENLIGNVFQRQQVTKNWVRFVVFDFARMTLKLGSFCHFLYLN